MHTNQCPGSFGAQKSTVKQHSLPICKLFGEAGLVFLGWVARAPLNGHDGFDVARVLVAKSIDDCCAKEDPEVCAVVKAGHDPRIHEPVWLVTFG